MKFVDELLANSKQFKEHMLDDSEFGIQKTFYDEMWPIPIPYKTLRLGYVHIAKQIKYMAETPDTDYLLSVNSERVDWTYFLSDLQALPNVRGMGGTGLHMQDLQGFPKLEEVFLGDSCDTFDAGAFPYLRTLSGSFDEGTRGIENNTNLRSLSMGFSPSKKFDFDCLLGLRSLKYLRITLGRFENLSFLQNCQELRVLNLDPVSWLREIKDLSFLQKLEVLFMARGKKVRDWNEFPYLKHLTKVRFNQCGEMELPAALKQHHAFEKGSFYKSKPVYHG